MLNICNQYRQEHLLLLRVCSPEYIMVGYYPAPCALIFAAIVTAICYRIVFDHDTFIARYKRLQNQDHKEDMRGEVIYRVFFIQKVLRKITPVEKYETFFSAVNSLFKKTVICII